MKLSKYILSVAAIATLTACGNLSNVTKEGTTDNPVWPEIEDAGVNFSGSQYGIWPNWDNVRMIEKGMNKDQLYYLIGRPHHAEGLFAVREWNYVFNYRENGEHKICQYKVLFDTDMNAQSFFWLPEGCGKQNNPYELSGDFLFDFDSANLSDNGRNVLNQVAAELKTKQANSITIEGFTDRLGSDSYNLALSQRRAETVKGYLVGQGLSAAMINAIGRGEAEQVKACNDIEGDALKECLRPNRRVVISSAQ
ncbi:plastocyanin [Chelonobacter oris]|uniref:Plastocyanin n=1 Tax=Chelonobacter oris TaxID=505317 RepID=A0A0A3ALH6_9PAST|nr:OmpA family protein [Chelonobacter oris]KGQ70233.1 plastocyanin [Chelonobacter oris]MDH2999618.1 plastocyanin [Chelonobacter oris]